MKQLIINADDFGWSKGVVDAIIEGHQKGVITSTTVMVTMPAFEYGVKKLKENPNLGVGIHLSLFDGNPVLPAEQVPSLINPETGTFLSLETVKKNTRKINHQEIRREFKAQIIRFLETGLKPTHLDNHCGLVYQKSKWLQAVLDLAVEYDLPLRSPFADDFEEKVPALAEIAKMPKFIVRFVGKRIRKKIDKAGIKRPDYFIEEFSFGDGSVDLLLASLSSIKEGVTELLTHPGYGEEWRENEMKSWLDPKINEVLSSDTQLELVDFRIFHQ